MKPLWTREEARAYDATVRDTHDVPTIVLMDRAAWSVIDAIQERWSVRRAVVVGATGQNSGDAWALARIWHTLGVEVQAYMVGDRRKLRGDAAVQYSALISCGVDMHVDCLPKAEVLEKADVVVEGLFGTGFHGALEGDYAEVVELINACGARVVALDIPSGLDANGVIPADQYVARRKRKAGSAKSEQLCISADLTVTFGAAKRGLYVDASADFVGEVEVGHLGFPLANASASVFGESESMCARSLGAFKGTSGHVGVVAGGSSVRGESDFRNPEQGIKVSTAGAASLVARGALRGGAGLVTVLASDESVRVDLAEVMHSFAFVSGEGNIEHLEAFDALVIGPGFGLSGGRATLLEKLALRTQVPAVIDADALRVFSPRVASFRSAAGPRVLTPHPGEAAALLGTSAGEIQRDRFRAAQTLAREAGQVVILKGARPIVATPNSLTVHEGRNPALAVGGSGDVLAGLLAAQLVGNTPEDAANAAVHLQQEAARHVSSDRGVLASEIADLVLKAF